MARKYLVRSVDTEECEVCFDMDAVKAAAAFMVNESGELDTDDEIEVYELIGTISAKIKIDLNYKEIKNV